LASWVPSQHLLMDTGKPRKTCVEVAGRRTFRTLPSRQQSGYNTRVTWPTHIIQLHWGLQQYTQLQQCTWKITTMHMENYKIT